MSAHIDNTNMIKKENLKDIYPLSPMQEGMLFHALLEPESTAYFEQMTFHISGKLDVRLFEASWQELTQRHDILRTVFVHQKTARPLQLVLKQRQLDFVVSDLLTLNVTEQTAYLTDFKQKDRQKSFDLTQDTLVRVHLFQTQIHRYTLVFSFHHILMDAWSAGILYAELLTIYQSLQKGQTPTLPAAFPYSRYIQWLEKQDKSASQAYWSKYLAGYEQVATLPKEKFDQIDTDKFELERGISQQIVILEADTTRKLQQLATQTQVTLNTVIQSLWGVLLAYYNNVDDVVFGATVSGRPAELRGIERTIGLFINTIPVRVQTNTLMTFKDLLQQVHAEALAGKSYHYARLADIQTHTRLKRDLLDHLLIFENVPNEEESTAFHAEIGFSIEQQGMFEHTHYDFVLAIQPGKTITFKITYNNHVYSDAQIARIADHYQQLLARVLENLNIKLNTLEPLTAAEKQQLLVDFNATVEQAVPVTTLAALFESQVERTPNAIAVVFEEQQLTYQQLNAKANQLAHYLQSLGVQPEVFVGICVERSIEMVIGLLGIMKAGGAYVPLDPAYPAARLAFMLEDAKVLVLLTQSHLKNGLSNTAATVVCLDIAETFSPFGSDNPASGVKPQNLAYVIYTSGSTGQPKGVMISHQSLVNFLISMQQKPGLSSQDILLAVTTISFDIAALELYLPLITGAKVIVVSRDVAVDGTQLLNTLVKFGVTMMQATPATWRLLFSVSGDEKWPLTILVGGEALPGSMAQALHEKADAVWNMYGPTETTVWSTVYPISVGPTDGQAISTLIGGPIAQTQIYILDPFQRLMPISVPGELHIGGVGLARGYLNRPELTAEKFIQNPFSDAPDSRLYKTGDLARWLPDGHLEFLGRIDNQVKIRGFRIELGEIEAVLTQYPGIIENAVIVHEDSAAGKRLVAYVVPQPEQQVIDKSELRHFLQERLPEHIIPSAFVTLTALPLTPNGKIDRRSLQSEKFSYQSSDQAFVAPRTSEEELLASLWVKILGVERVGIHDNFFELGGHSLLATQVISRIRDTFSVELPLRHLFESPTIVGLNEHIQNARRDEPLPPIVPINRNEPLPLSFSQQRLWFLDQLEGPSATYNMPAALRLEGQLQPETLEQTLQEMVQRHENLRTCFPTLDDTPVVQIMVENYQLPWRDLQSLSPEEQRVAVQRLVSEDAQRPFDLATGPLFRTTLLQLGPDSYVLLLNIHHIISDGWSIGVFIQELSIIYEAFSQGLPSPLPPLPIQYVDFAHWQRQWLVGELLEQQVNYWKQHLANVPALLELPTDHPRPPMQRFQGSTVKFTLSEALTQSLKTLSQQAGITLFMTLWSAFATLLYRYSGQTDILIGSPIAGRTQSQLESLIGFFVNTLVLRLNLESQPRFEEVLQQARRIALEAYAHQDIPFEQLVEVLKPERNLSYSPLFQVMFVLQNAPRENLDLSELHLTFLEPENVVAMFDLSLFMVETEQGLAGALEYNTDLFERATIERMAGHLKTLLTGLNPRLSIDELALLTEAEQQQLRAWNDTQVDYPSQKTVVDLFEEQVEKTPNALAIIFEKQSLTYHQLNAKANQLAHYLQTLGVKPEVLVGIYIERSVEMVMGLLGILKAGGAYVPLDPIYPLARLAFMLEDAKVPVLLTQSSLTEGLPTTTAQVIYLDKESATFSPFSADNLASDVTPANLAYVIYTSGSTGQPKGVMICHSSLVNFLTSMQQQPGLTSQDRLLAVTTISFDIAALELYLPLITGAQIILAARDTVVDGTQLLNVLVNHDVTMMQATPATWRLLFSVSGDKKWPLNQILVGGEALPSSMAQALQQKANAVWNLYGPTETTIWSTVYQVKTRSPVIQEQEVSELIGRPIANTQIYILDRFQGVVPVSVPGELHIGGVGLARCYLNRPELTTEKFIRNPFSDAPESRLYKTGDLARYRGDGTVEFLGRIDNQVKIRGFRIELGEIEAALLKHSLVADAAVIVQEEGQDKRLFAYFMPQSSHQSQSAETIDHESEIKQVEQWQQIWSETYGQSTVAEMESQFNTIGWNSSYTGLPISKAEMKEWLDGTVEQILSTSPNRILEIGCGTGMLLFKIAPYCHHYTGTDISSQALHYIEQQKKTWEFGSKVTLFQRAADNLEDIKPGSIDAVILNSVVQYFPSIDYLVTVLTGAIKAVAPGGFIFIGDVRNLQLLEAFHASVQLYQAQDSLSLLELQQRVQKSIRSEKELLIDPDFFVALKHHLPQITQVQIQLKPGYAHHEMSCFRYDVTLHIGSQSTIQRQVQWLDWPAEQLTLATVRQWLVEKQPDIIGFKRIPNARLVAEMKLLEQLVHPEGTVAQLRTILSEPNHGIEPEEFRVLTEGLPYTSYLNYGDKYSYHVVFQRQISESTWPRFEAVSDVAKKPWHTYANNPFQDALTRPQFVSQLRDFLKQTLPDYMIPSALIPLESMPLTPNGKKDRRALAQLSVNIELSEKEFVVPNTAEEKLLARIWAEVLGVERVGIHNNFFDLGGHSLQAVQLISKIALAMNIDISVKQVFLYPTIAQLATLLEKRASTHNPIAQNNSTSQLEKQSISSGELEVSESSPYFQQERRSLLSLLSAKKIPPVNAAALGYLPNSMLEQTDLNREEILEQWFDNLPVISNIRETAWGRIALILLPRFNTELYGDTNDIVEVSLDALEIAGQIGANTVSLTGMIPSATDYGRVLAKAMADRHLPAITTGHATRSATVVLAIQKILQNGGREMMTERVGIIGLSSVGFSSLCLVLKCLPHPAEIMLCDLYGKKEYLKDIRDKLIKNLDFHGKIQILFSEVELPEDIYDATLIIGATNVPDVLDINTVKSGTLIVDDSEPHCFNLELAVKRLQEHQDILFTEGDVLKSPKPIHKMVHLPHHVEKSLKSKPSEELAKYNPFEITGCIFSSVLSSSFENLKPTVGFVELNESVKHYETLISKGFEAADLHCEDYVLPLEAISHFRERFGHSGMRI